MVNSYLCQSPLRHTNITVMWWYVIQREALLFNISQFINSYDPITEFYHSVGPIFSHNARIYLWSHKPKELETPVHLQYFNPKMTGELPVFIDILFYGSTAVSYPLASESKGRIACPMPSEYNWHLSLLVLLWVKHGAYNSLTLRITVTIPPNLLSLLINEYSERILF